MITETPSNSLRNSYSSHFKEHEHTIINTEINCDNCKKYVMKTALKFSCDHVMCIACISLELLKKGLAPLQTTTEDIIVDCFCGKGQCIIPIKTLLLLLNVDDLCIKHGEENTCSKCVVWASQYERPKLCKFHEDKYYTNYCKTCESNICDTCLNSMHKEHKIINFAVYGKEIDEIRLKKIKNKNYHQFLNYFAYIEKEFQKAEDNEYNKVISKIDNIIAQLNVIKNRYILRMNNRKEQLNQIVFIIKYIYYYYYKVLFAKENDYNTLSALHKNKYDLENIILFPVSNLSNELTKCTNIVENISIDSFDYKINVRNTYSYVSSEFLGHEGYVLNLIQINKNQIVSCSEDKRIIIWDVHRNSKVHEIQKAHNSAVYSLCKLKNKKKFASGSFGEIKIWSSETFEELTTLRGHMDYVVNMKIIKVNAEAKPDLFHDNKHALASCSFDYTVKIWDINHYSCLFTLKGHLGNVNAIVQFNSDYSQIVTCSYDKTIKFWDLKDEKCVYTIEGHDSPVYAMIILSDGRLVSGSYKDIKFWNAKNKKCEHTFIERNMGVYYFVQIDDGRLASCSFKSINFWDVRENRWIYSLDEHMNFVTCLLILKDGRLASASDDQTIKIWE